MLSSFLITFRETLEAALIIGIIFSYLSKIKQTKQYNVVYLGIIAGIAASLIGAYLLSKLSGGLDGTSHQIFEGTVTLIGALLLVTMIIWMMRQKHMIKKLENKIDQEVTSSKKLGLFSLVFVSILREGVELVIFLSASGFSATTNSLLGAITGILVAILMGYLIFIGAMKINMKIFFNVIGVILILFAVSLVIHGLNEFGEAGVISFELFED